MRRAGGSLRFPALARYWPPALVASVADPKAFRSGRNFSAWIGLVPKQHERGKGRLGSISKQGDRYLRSLFMAGAARRHSLCQDPRHQASALAHGIVGASANPRSPPSHSPTRWRRMVWVMMARKANATRNPSRLRRKQRSRRMSGVM